MIKLNSIELKQIYDFDNNAGDSQTLARNLAYKLGTSSWNNNLFEPYLTKLINSKVLTVVYDFVNDGYREALYQFENGNQVEVIGSNHMSYKLFYAY